MQEAASNESSAPALSKTKSKLALAGEKDKAEPEKKKKRKLLGGGKPVFEWDPVMQVGHSHPCAARSSSMSERGWRDTCLSISGQTGWQRQYRNHPSGGVQEHPFFPWTRQAALESEYRYASFSSRLY